MITSINGRQVANATELRNSIGLLRIGDKVEIGLIRESKPRRVTPSSANVRQRCRRSGGDSSFVRRRFVHDAENGGGVVVQAVAAGSPAAQAGLRPNDVILSIGRARIETSSSCERR